VVTVFEAEHRRDVGIFSELSNKRLEFEKTVWFLVVVNI